MKKCKQCGILREFSLYFDERFDMCKKCYNKIPPHTIVGLENEN
jgi:hypothetical protein